ncbi:MAG: hypothetical protein ACRDKX_04800, partial [Solirubrobacterales bacterium]
MLGDVVRVVDLQHVGAVGIREQPYGPPVVGASGFSANCERDRTRKLSSKTGAVDFDTAPGLDDSGDLPNAIYRRDRGDQAVVVSREGVNCVQAARAVPR